jgi:hypothetical protein
MNFVSFVDKQWIRDLIKYKIRPSQQSHPVRVFNPAHTPCAVPIELGNDAGRLIFLEYCWSSDSIGYILFFLRKKGVIIYNECQTKHFNNQLHHCSVVTTTAWTTIEWNHCFPNFMYPFRAWSITMVDFHRRKFAEANGPSCDGNTPTS